MTEIHNCELTQDVILGAVAAWLEQKNDSAMSIEVGFHRDLTRKANYDLIAETKVTVLKPQDYRVSNPMHFGWNEDSQKFIDTFPMVPPEEKKKDGDAVELIKDAVNAKKSAEESTDPKGVGQGQRGPMEKRVWSDEVVKFKAVRREIPSADYYPIKFIEGVSRKLGRRTSASELDTAQEAPAVREKGEANDRTDQDCKTLPTDMASSKETLAAEAPTQMEKSPPRSDEREEPKETVKGKTSPIQPIPEKKEEKEAVKSVEEKKIVEKQEEPPTIQTTPKTKKSRIIRQVNMKRSPDTGQLTILSESNGIVTFSCSTKHRVKKSKTKSKAKSKTSSSRSMSTKSR